MNIALATNGLSVPQPLGHTLNGSSDIPFRGCLRIEIFEFLQGLSGKRRSRPGSEVLGREFLAGDLLQIRIDVAGADVMNLALFICVFKEFPPGKFPALPALDFWPGAESSRRRFHA